MITPTVTLGHPHALPRAPDRALVVFGTLPTSPAQASWWLRSGLLTPRTNLSDHLPIISPALSFGRVLSWNILTWCRYDRHRLNNGFGFNEDEREYRGRLSAIGARLARLSAPPVSVVALQEVPIRQPTHLAPLLRALDPETWWVSTRACDGHSFGMLLAARRAVFSSIKAVVEDQRSPQARRIQEIDLVRLDRPALRVGNVHLHWGRSAVAELEARVQSPFSLLAGDFNRDPSDPLRQLDRLSHLHGLALVFPDRPTSISFHRDAEPAVATIDGFVLGSALCDHSQ